MANDYVFENHIPAIIYLFKANSRNTRKRSKNKQ